MTSGELGVEEGEDEILEGGGDVATRGTMRVKLRQKVWNSFIEHSEQFGRPRTRLTQECGELCQLR